MTIGVSFGLSRFQEWPNVVEGMLQNINEMLVEQPTPVEMPEDSVLEYADPHPLPDCYGPNGPGRALSDAYPASMLLLPFDLAQQREGCHVPPGDKCGGVMVFLPIALDKVLIANGWIDELETPFWVGSAHRLLDDLVACARKLGIELVDGALTDEVANEIEDVAGQDGEGWLLLYESARLAIEHKMAMVISD